MAYTSCIGAIAKNIAEVCGSEIVAGYTGRGVLIPWESITGIAKNTNDPRTITAITLETSAKVAVIDNIFAEPFSGSSTASGADSGRVAFTKTVAFRIPMRGAGTSKDLVEPLAKSALGFVLVLEKKDKVGDGSFEVIGSHSAFHVNADGISRDEAANGGDIMVTGAAVEPYFECALFDTDYATSKTAFEALVSKAF